PMPCQMVARLLPVLNALQLFQGQGQPAFEQSAPHGGAGVVDDLQKGDPVLVGGMVEFQVSDRKTVQPDVLFLGDAGNAVDMAQPVMLGFGEVMQHRPGGNDALLQMPKSETLEGIGPKMAVQAFPGVILLKDPFLQKETVVVPAKEFLELLFVGLGDQ